MNPEASKATLAPPIPRLGPDRESSSILLGIIFCYSAVSTLWIYFSDEGLLMVTKDPKVIIYWSIVKGWIFVAVTSTLLFLILKRFVEKIGTVNTSLKKSEETFHTLFEASREALTVSDENGFLDGNAAVINLFRCASKAEFLSKHPGELSPLFQPDGKDSLGAAKERLAAAIATGSQFFEWMHKRMDGTLFPAEVMLSRFELHGKKVLQATVRDITERKRVQEALQASETKLRNLVEHLPHPMFVKDRNSVFLACNRAYARDLGIEPEAVVGKLDFDFSPRELAEKYRMDDHRIITTGRSELYEEINSHKGCEKWVQVTKVPYRDALGNIVGILGVYEDISERKQMQEHILRSQRMESIGTLAGGIAHDLNNILAPIVMVSHLMSTETDEERKLVEPIRESAKRAADLVKQLLSFARGVEGRRIELDAGHLIKETEKMLRETFPKNILITLNVTPNLWRLTADPTQINQVLMNLCVNARDAMPRGGTLILGAHNQELDGLSASMNLSARPGPYVAITVSDTGTGIAPEIEGRIFDPFFTTKEVGKGTGLGLSTTLGIVNSHSGFIDIKSDPETGTTFHVYIPAREAALPPREEPKETPPPRGQSELVLIVDDEPNLLAMVKRSMEIFGYRVIAARDGKEAVEKFVLHQNEIAVVMTDLMMPVMDGASTIQAMVKIKPDVKIIATTGLATEAQIAAATEAGAKHFLPKPYTPKALLDILQEVLGRR